MTKVICACVECKHNDDSRVCTKETIGLSNHYIQTIWEGPQQFWRCTEFEESERTKEIKRFLEGIR